MGCNPEDSPSLNQGTRRRTRYSLVDGDLLPTDCSTLEDSPQHLQNQPLLRLWQFNGPPSYPSAWIMSKNRTTCQGQGSNPSTPHRTRAKSIPRKKSSLTMADNLIMSRSRTQSVPCNVIKQHRFTSESNTITIATTTTGSHDNNQLYPQLVRRFSMSSKGSIINHGDSVRLLSLTNLPPTNTNIPDIPYPPTSPTSGSSSSTTSPQNSMSSGSIPSFRDLFRSRKSSGQSQSSSCSSIEIEPHRVLLMGKCGVGKSSLAQQFMTSEDVTQLDHQIDQLPGKNKHNTNSNLVDYNY